MYYLRILLVWSFVLAGSVAASGCSLIVGSELDDYEFADAGADDGSVADASTEAAVWDGGAYDGGPDTSPVDSGSGCDLHVSRLVHERGTTCPSGEGAGLARFDDDSTSEINATAVSSCVSLSVEGSGTLVFDAHHVRETCGDSCGEDYCGDPMTLLVFATDRDGNTTRILSEVLTAYPGQHAVNTRPEYTELLFCRGGGGPGRDNIVVERLRAC